MTRVFLVLALVCVPLLASAQDEPPPLFSPNPTPVPKSSQNEEYDDTAKADAEAPAQNLSESVLRDITNQTNQFLKQEEKPQLTDLEIQEVANIIEGWSTPVSTSVFLYLLVFSAIMGHSFITKKYKWCAGMMLFGAFAPALGWLPPISYTRRHIYPGVFSQQLPVILIQILPTFVWWAALADIGHWFERIGMARGVG